MATQLPRLPPVGPQTRRTVTTPFGSSNVTTLGAAGPDDLCLIAWPEWCTTDGTRGMTEALITGDAWVWGVVYEGDRPMAEELTTGVRWDAAKRDGYMLGYDWMRHVPPVAVKQYRQWCAYDYMVRTS